MSATQNATWSVRAKRAISAEGRIASPSTAWSWHRSLQGDVSVGRINLLSCSNSCYRGAPSRQEWVPLIGRDSLALVFRRTCQPREGTEEEGGGPKLRDATCKVHSSLPLSFEPVKKRP